MEKLYYSIGEVKEITGIASHVLRYWESEFKLLRPRKDRSGRRMYQKKDLEKIDKIKDLLYRRRFSIAGAKKHLQSETEGDISNRDLFSRIKTELLTIKSDLEKD
ncbi:MAG: MerR family transcriptional regulator [Candidatus Tritonobacter lacicola]|nr:MerR family transcriptional regulator [Candidatus Tritonobacter lacicola]